MRPVSVKICGLSTEPTLDAALESGADLVGFVHFPKSPRHVSLERAGALSRQAGGRVQRVVLLVDPDDALVTAAVEAISPDLIQLHGHESVERVAAIRRLSGRPVMKAIGVAAASDLAAVPAYAAVADRILLDAKPPKDAVLPGGNGLVFDWALIAQATLPTDWMLSGGLTANNVRDALLLTGTPALDVSSGVESAPGTKDPAAIAAFIKAARG
ncbi:phosphoribosylanthranilate isomerase [Methylobacterium gnaphalii]|uniref:N-(5'-phosphoribosyl)anthranilate isomerase n=1 Tax=Methylobacterium gnaphalii TaxID=1010610 RepID=A0A512JG43_9HYPH|nr:phosphoribosylanthranilate isomerase [Methylobacterium gnaphalii]GEP08924.1 N-(5'-phosphoribosyl)anthranilate isomerase [Methylobacterium gnaphalii]GJD70691.1 N-(5'-phosphoribosyl)anthranilate isomerase [Methylobacterium gnaphalii]GLS50431.1 N-(5'-phosphoribosyl)anthranilate isomerase [Methylobacterium gnaphalii]